MTNEQILKKVIEKAEKNGWEKTSLIFHENLTNDWNYPDLELEQVHYIIFSHDFLKAFFGKKKWKNVNCDWKYDGMCQECYSDVEMLRWQFHAQQLVLEKEPLKYLEKFL